jgi:hypothetical protein
MKHSKCAFGAHEVEYLGHIVSPEGVRVDPKKVAAMKDCLCPKTLKSLRGFLGHVIAQFVARKKGYKVEGQTGVTGTYPTQCHHDGEVLSL